MVGECQDGLGTKSCSLPCFCRVALSKRPTTISGSGLLRSLLEHGNYSHIDGFFSLADL